MVSRVGFGAGARGLREQKGGYPLVLVSGRSPFLPSAVVEVVATRSHEGHIVKVVAGNCM